MKICIVGSGAIGGWMAGLFADAGCEVSLLARGATLANIRIHGLRIRRAGTESIYKLDASDDPARLAKADYLVVAVKGQNLPDLAPTLRALCGSQTCVVPAINGIPWWFFQASDVPLAGFSLATVDPQQSLSRAIEAQRIIGCVVHASAWSSAPGIVEVAGEDKLIFGEPGGETSVRLTQLCEVLGRTQVQAAASSNIRRDIWTKLWGNMTMNPLSVLTGATTGAMLRDPDIRALVRAMMLEMQAIGARIGLSIDMTPEQRMDITLKLGDFKTSMLRDAEAGREIEIGPILGALVEIAGRVEEPAPFIRAVLGLLRMRAPHAG
jgi:2-dehydropantoate 2-reductase